MDPGGGGGAPYYPPDPNAYPTMPGPDLPGDDYLPPPDQGQPPPGSQLTNGGAAASTSGTVWPWVVAGIGVLGLATYLGVLYYRSRAS